MSILWKERLILIIVLILLFYLRKYTLKIYKNTKYKDNSLVEMRVNGAILAILGWFIWTFFR